MAEIKTYDYKHLNTAQVKEIVKLFANDEQKKLFLEEAFAPAQRKKMVDKKDENGNTIPYVNKKDKATIRKTAVKVEGDTFNPFNIRRAINWIMANLYNQAEGLVITGYKAEEKPTLTADNFFDD